LADTLEATNERARHSITDKIVVGVSRVFDIGLAHCRARGFDDTATPNPGVGASMSTTAALF
jgi:hypothetical protein